jgi:hypothetical protein
MWKSELALLIDLAVLVWTGVAARRFVARYLADPQPGITCNFAPQPWTPDNRHAWS